MTAVHLPKEAVELPHLITLAGRLEQDGYDGLWVGEVNGVDAASCAALAASGTERAAIGVLLNTFTRSPTVLAMTAWTLAHLARDRAHVVLGVASPLLVEQWNGIPYRRLHDRLRDVLRFLRTTLEGRPDDGGYETFSTSGFALPRSEASPPSLHVAACGPRALALAAEAADGVVLNWVRPDDLERIAPVPEDRSRISLVIPVCPTAARDEMEQVMRPVIADYLHAPAYARQQTTLGRGELLEPMWRAWSTGGRKAARAAVPSAILDDLVIWGDVAACRQRVADIERATGVRVIATFFPPRGVTYSEVALSETRQLQRTRGGSPTHDSRDR